MEQNTPQDILDDANRLYPTANSHTSTELEIEGYKGYIAGRMDQLAKQQVNVSESVEEAAKEFTDLTGGSKDHKRSTFLSFKAGWHKGAAWANQQPSQGYSEKEVERILRQYGDHIRQGNKVTKTAPEWLSQYKPSAPIQVGGWSKIEYMCVDFANWCHIQKEYIRNGNNSWRKLNTTIEMNTLKLCSIWLSEYRKTHSPIPDKRIEEYRKILENGNMTMAGIALKEYNKLFPPTKTETT